MTWKVKLLPRRLETSTHLTKLFENTSKELNAHKGFKSKTKFQVQIDNLAEKNAKADKKPEKKGKATTKVRVKTSPKSARHWVTEQPGWDDGRTTWLESDAISH
jgi:TPR repeat protein